MLPCERNLGQPNASTAIASQAQDIRVKYFTTIARRAQQLTVKNGLWIFRTRFTDVANHTQYITVKYFMDIAGSRHQGATVQVQWILLGECNNHIYILSNDPWTVRKAGIKT